MPVNVFGIVRLTHLRDVVDWYLNSGKDSPLTTNRDGFDAKHPFTRVLFDELEKQLKPLYERERARFEKDSAGTVPQDVKRRVDEAIKELNKLLREFEGEGDDGEGAHQPDPNIDFQFVPCETKLAISKRRSVQLYLRSEVAKKSGEIVYDVDNRMITVAPLSHSVPEGRERGAFLVFRVGLEAEVLHEKGEVVALTEGKDGHLHEAKLKVVDVTAGPVTIPPIDMEFRPVEAHGQPNRTNMTWLFINPAAIPLGRKIWVEIEKAWGGIGLLSEGSKREEIEVKFEKRHIIEGAAVGRVPIPWQGGGWGQSASLIAKTKRGDGSIARAEGRIALIEPDKDGGMIREIKYIDFGDDRCSDLSDGIIYINSRHYLNRFVFGSSQPELYERLRDEGKAQYRYASLVVEQAVYRVAETRYTENQLVLTDHPVADIRRFVDQQTQKLSPRILKTIVTKEAG